MRKRRKFWKTKKGKLATTFIVTGLFLGVGSGLILTDTVAENKKTVTADQIADAMTGKQTDKKEISEKPSSTSTPYPRLDFSKSASDNNDKKTSEDKEESDDDDVEVTVGDEDEDADEIADKFDSEEDIIEDLKEMDGEE